MNKFRVLMPSSSGGHLTELFQLKELLAQTEHLFVTEDLPLTRELLQGMPCKFVRPNGRNRNWVFWKNFIINWFLAVPIILKFRPHAIVARSGEHCQPALCRLGQCSGQGDGAAGVAARTSGCANSRQRIGIAAGDGALKSRDSYLASGFPNRGGDAGLAEPVEKHAAILVVHGVEVQLTAQAFPVRH